MINKDKVSYQRIVDHIFKCREHYKVPTDRQFPAGTSLNGSRTFSVELFVYSARRVVQ